MKFIDETVGRGRYSMARVDPRNSFLCVCTWIATGMDWVNEDTRRTRGRSLRARSYRAPRNTATTRVTDTKKTNRERFIVHGARPWRSSFDKQLAYLTFSTLFLFLFFFFFFLFLYRNSKIHVFLYEL